MTASEYIFAVAMTILIVWIVADMEHVFKRHDRF
jgi:hypothetical protein